MTSRLPGDFSVLLRLPVSLFVTRRQLVHKRPLIDLLESPSLLNLNMIDELVSATSCYHIHCIFSRRGVKISTTSYEVKEKLQNLDITKATDPDAIPARIPKACSGELSAPLAHLFNLCFNQSRIPMHWKLTTDLQVTTTEREIRDLQD